MMDALHPPEVTVVVATYRSQPEHLRAALHSALGQTWRALEVVVSDDSPDDALRALVVSLEDVRLHYRHNQPALGVAHNHWACFEAAQGEFIVVLNHDDLLEPHSVEILVQALRCEPQAVLAFADHWIIDTEGQRLLADTDRNSQAWGRHGLRPGRHQPFVDLVARQTIPMAMGTMFRRSALTSVCPPGAGPAYDLWLTYLLSRGGGGAVYVPERLSAWRSHPTNLTSQGGTDWLLGAATCWQAMAVDPLTTSIACIARRKAARWFYASARAALRAGRSDQARQHARRSWQLGPSLRAALAWLLSLRPGRGTHA